MLSFWSDYLWFLDEVCRPRWWFVSNKSTSVPTNFIQYCWKSFDLMNSKKLLWCKVLWHVWLRCLNLFQGVTQYSNLSCIFFFIWTKNNITDPLIIPTLLRLQSFRRICFKFVEIWNLILTKNYNCPKGLVVYPIPPCAPSQFFKSGLLRILFFFPLLLYIPWLTYLLPFMRHRTFG